MDHRGGGIWSAGGWVESESSPGKRYHVSVTVEVDMFTEKRGVHILKYSCECNDFLYRGLDRPCKHVYALVEHIKPQLDPETKLEANWWVITKRLGEERRRRLVRALEELLGTIMLRIIVGGEEMYCIPTPVDTLNTKVEDGVASTSFGFECRNELAEVDMERIEKVEETARFRLAGAEVEVYKIQYRRQLGAGRHPLRGPARGEQP